MSLSSYHVAILAYRPFFLNDACLGSAVEIGG
jgi:hypothetical protein